MSSQPNQPETTEPDPPPEDTFDSAKDDGTDAEPVVLPNDVAVEDLTLREIAFYCAEYLVEENEFIALRDTGELYTYDDGVWIPNGEQFVREWLCEHLGLLYRKSITGRVVDQIRGKAAKPRGEVGVPADHVVVDNGLLDLTDGQVRPLRPEDRVDWQMSVEWDPTADCGEFRDFLREVCPTRDRALLQEYVGYCLMHDRAPHEKALMLLGPTDSGKSVFLDVIEALFGGENNAGQSLQYLVGSRWGTNELFNRPVNIRHDLDPASIKNTGRAKEIISGNTVHAEQKFKNGYTFEPTTKHLFSANTAPEPETDDDAFWNRWLTVVFPDRIPRSEQDPTLVQTLTTPDELSGILNWAVEGYQRLEANGRFTNEPDPSENRRRWQRFSTSTGRFIEARLERDPEGEIKQSRAYEAFKQFATEHDLEIVRKASFTQKLKQQPGVGVGQRRFDDGRERVYTGVTLR